MSAETNLKMSKPELIEGVPPIKKEAEVPAVKATRALAVTSFKMPKGLENFDPEDIRLPRAKLMQPTSDEIVEGAEGLKPGLLINNVTQRVLPDVFIPISFQKEWILFGPRSKNDPHYDRIMGAYPNAKPGQVIFKTTNRLSQEVKDFGQWEGNVAPAATAFLNYLCLFEGEKLPLSLGFARTSIQAARDIAMAVWGEEASYHFKFRLTTKKIDGSLGTYFVMKTKRIGDASPEEIKRAEEFYAFIQAYKPNVEGEQDEIPF